MVKKKELTVEKSLKNSKVVHEDPFYVCQICHRCLYKRSVQNFERNIKNESSNPVNVFLI